MFSATGICVAHAEFSKPLPEEISQLIFHFAPKIDEFKLALLSTFAPPNPATTRSNWRRLKAFGNDAPLTEVLRNVLEEADFRCQKCRGSLRINIDHVDDNNKNHEANNLQVLCTKCNIKKANKGIKNEDAQFVIYSEFWNLCVSLNRVPETRELASHIKRNYPFQNRPLAGYLHLYRFLVFRYNNPVKPPDDYEKFTIFLNQLIEILEISEDEIKRAILSKCTPPDEYSKVSNWRNDKNYGNSAPDASIIRRVFQKSGYKCNICKSVTSFTVDHIDSNPKNHSEDNLQLLCLLCNRDKSAKPIKIRYFKVKIYDLIIHHFLENNKILTRREVIEGISGCSQLGGEIHFRHFLEKRLLTFCKNK
jgi:5-methylcytosine-specific restriction endonuclease McrA